MLTRPGVQVPSLRTAPPPVHWLPLSYRPCQSLNFKFAALVGPNLQNHYHDFKPALHPLPYSRQRTAQNLQLHPPWLH